MFGCGRLTFLRPSQDIAVPWKWTAIAGCFWLMVVPACSCGFHEDCHCSQGSDGGPCPPVADAASAVPTGKDSLGEPLAEATPDAQPSISLDTALDLPLVVVSSGADGGAKTWVDDCGGTVGRYDNGAIKAPGTAAFEKTYLQYFPQLGCPYDNGGGVFVHVPCAGIEVQDFIQSDTSRALSGDGRSMLVLNPGLSRAFALYDQIWVAYACMHADECGAAMGGLALLGPPTSDRYPQGSATRQDFQRGWMTFDGSSQVTVHLSEQRAIGPSMLSGCWGDGEAPWISMENGGAVDASVADVRVYPSACSQSLTFDNPEPRHNETADDPACSLDQNGSLTLQYSDLQCPQNRPYRGCVFMQDQDMMRFDPDALGSGVYEILFCIDGPVNGAVNLWYEPEGCDSCRRYLPLLAGGSDPGCHRIYIGPGDVNRGSPDQQSHCTARLSGKASCADSGTIGALAEDAAPLSPSPSPPPDASGLDASDAATNLRRSKLVLMNEWCEPSKSVVSSSSPVTITLVSMTYHPGECLCQKDGDCQPGSTCRHVAWPNESCCQCDCPGFCE
jgi:hypothetical protein